MARLRASRWLRALLALVWCGTAAARPSAMPCPMGGHREAVSQETSAPAMQHAMAGDMAMGDDMAMAGHSIAAEHSPAPLPETDHGNNHSSHHACDCLTNCCATALVVPVTLSSTIHIAEHVAQPRAVSAHTPLVATWVDFVLPFAIAPPANRAI